MKKATNDPARPVPAREQNPRGGREYQMALSQATRVPSTSALTRPVEFDRISCFGAGQITVSWVGNDP